METVHVQDILEKAKKQLSIASGVAARTLARSRESDDRVVSSGWQALMRDHHLSLRPLSMLMRVFRPLSLIILRARLFKNGPRQGKPMIRHPIIYWTRASSLLQINSPVWMGTTLKPPQFVVSKGWARYIIFCWYFPYWALTPKAIKSPVVALVANILYCPFGSCGCKILLPCGRCW